MLMALDPCSVVEFGDLGTKIGYDSTANGYALFSDVRIPRNHLLMGHAKVHRDGFYVPTLHDKRRAEDALNRHLMEIIVVARAYPEPLILQDFINGVEPTKTTYQVSTQRSHDSAPSSFSQPLPFYNLVMPSHLWKTNISTPDN
ncbi:hypothetical protein AJ78_00260 [Emergomyces pasteurianus Ep9510]|uniref:Uncharacterized protein n=1 Tax=Emergomyces pasteurianus Ep9510 TaxID=1447872 RepID=A0A1J9PTN4_9EURO|nr:hypothetical protein AJ78_00260 [Emergomyces pasteurianus Ep9510]